MSLPKEPVGHTCPDIDRLKSEILEMVKSIEYLLDELSDKTEDEIESELLDCTDTLYHMGMGHRCSLEELRESNGALRSWGQDLYTIAEDLEKENTALKETIEGLEEELNYHKELSMNVLT